jgi:hypothetical protein
MARTFPAGLESEIFRVRKEYAVTNWAGEPVTRVEYLGPYGTHAAAKAIATSIRHQSHWNHSTATVERASVGAFEAVSE